MNTSQWFWDRVGFVVGSKYRQAFRTTIFLELDFLGNNLEFDGRAFFFFLLLLVHVL